MEMEISSEEKKLLENALNHYLTELDGEIRNTDNHDFRSGLKHEHEVLRILAEKLGTE